MLNNKVLSMLSLATRAGKLVSGEFTTEQKIKENKAYLVVIASDASANTKKKFHDMCTYYKVSIIEFETKENIGHAIGKELRASVAILDQGFAKAIMEKLDCSKSMEVVIDE